MKKLLFLAVLLASLLACNLPLAGIERQTPLNTQADGLKNETDRTPEPAAEPGGQSGDPTLLPATVGIGKTASRLRVAYIKDGNIWLWTEGGSAVQLTQSGKAVWLKLSPDGEGIAFIRQLDEFHNELWAVNTDGSGERCLVSAAELEQLDTDQRDPNSKSLIVYHFDWAPGSHIVAFNTRQTYEGPGLAIFDDLRLVDAATSKLATLLHPGKGGEFYYSPDGRQIAIVNPTQISLVDADGRNRREALSYYQVITYSEYQYYAHPEWSPDSASLHVALPPSDPLAEPRQPTTLWVIPADGRPARQVASVLAIPFFASEVSYSPDLAHVIYLVQTGDPAQNLLELHIANADGSQDSTYLTGKNLSLQGWAGDAHFFVFTFGDNRAMELGRIGDKNYHPLTSDPVDISSLRWIDGEQFIYLQGKLDENSWDLFLGSTQGKSRLIDSIPGLAPSFDVVK